MPTAAETTRPSAVDHLSHLRPAKKNTMSITQTYYLAHKARAKLSREAAQPDHDLRLLVGHANLLDSLMLELADAEREQERWFNNSVRRADSKASRSSSSERHIQWVDQVVEEAIDSDEEEEEIEYDSETSDSDSDSEYDEDEMKMHISSSSSPSPSSSSRPLSSDEDVSNDDLEEDYAQLELVRAPSHSNSTSSSPPELVDHDFESSDDEVMLPSPVDAELHHPLDKDIAMADQEESLFEEEYYQPAPAGLVPAIPVY